MAVYGAGNMLLGRAYLTDKECTEMDIREMIKSDKKMDVAKLIELIESIKGEFYG